ncbi:MAG: hypothetical protein U5K54_10345 [Cytophagales bacterium]|nr:hypothetical protein [Cytophagales bacterium]
MAFLQASVVDIEMITDHAIIATLFRLALKENIKFILSGTNFVTEAILPQHWIHHKADYIHIRAIQKNSSTSHSKPTRYWTLKPECEQS